jgi:hypothetical protein
MISVSTTNNDASASAAAAGSAFNPAGAASSSSAYHNNNPFSGMTESTNVNNNGASSGGGGGDEEDPLTLEAENAITRERQHLTKENTARLQSILESIKDSTKNILNEMNVFLKEAEEVEKVYVRCRAKTARETRRLELVEPEVMGMLSGSGGGGSMMMGMMGMFGANSNGMMMGMNMNVGSGGENGTSSNTITPRNSL